MAQKNLEAVASAQLSFLLLSGMPWAVASTNVITPQF
jgi:hypothetical protein